jgi:23S rRNA pseudouridine2605 synthase
MIKKRRPRVGEIIDRQSGGAYNRNNTYQQKPQLQKGRKNKPTPNRNQPFNRNLNAKYSLQKQLKYREENFDPEELIRLNKYLANAGICSRREADAFIQSGVVKVNGETVTELGTKVKRADQVSFHEQPVKLEHKIYVLLNKPKNCVTTADDPQERLTVMDLVKNACQERIFPVGRLDRNTTGVLLLTNDGDLASKLTHPKFLKKKIYHVWLDKNVSIEDMQKLADGIELDDGEIHADAISYVTDTDKDQVGIEIHSGRNRIVRRMFESLGYHVIKLDRVYFAGLTKKNLKRGHWRYLNEKEVSMLRMGAFE